MQFVFGLLTAVVLFVVVSVSLYIGFKLGKKKSQPTSQIDENEKLKIEKFNKHFKSLFAYDVETALQRKKVT
jgi:hypothetical protein